MRRLAVPLALGAVVVLAYAAGRRRQQIRRCRRMGHDRSTRFAFDEGPIAAAVAMATRLKALVSDVSLEQPSGSP